MAFGYHILIINECVFFTDTVSDFLFLSENNNEQYFFSNISSLSLSTSVSLKKKNEHTHTHKKEVHFTAMCDGETLLRTNGLFLFLGVEPKKGRDEYI